MARKFWFSRSDFEIFLLNSCPDKNSQVDFFIKLQFSLFDNFNSMPSSSSHSKSRTRHRTRQLNVFKIKYLRSLVRCLVWDFEWLEKLDLTQEVKSWIIKKWSKFFWAWNSITDIAIECKVCKRWLWLAKPTSNCAVCLQSNTRTYVTGPVAIQNTKNSNNVTVAAVTHSLVY